MQIISASRRTDIPAFYTPWLLNRLKEGFARVPNPFNPHQIRTVDLRPRQVAALCLWTRDPRPLLPHLGDLKRRGYRTLFQVTLTGLPRVLEPAVPAPDEILPAVRELAEQVGPQRVIWRFDPVLISSLTPESFILQRFEDLAEELVASVREVKISFARYYRQIPPRLKGDPVLKKIKFFDPASHTAEDALQKLGPLASALADCARSRGLKMTSCAERFDLRPFGIAPGRCIDAEQLREAFGLNLPHRRDRGQRPQCGCLPSVDLGVYGTCRHRCIYCYAAKDRRLAQGRHDPRGSLLFGEESAGAEEGQLNLF